MAVQPITKDTRITEGAVGEDFAGDFADRVCTSQRLSGLRRARGVCEVRSAAAARCTTAESPARRWPDGALVPSPRNAGRAHPLRRARGRRVAATGRARPSGDRTGSRSCGGQTAAGTGKLGASVRKRSVAASVASLLAAMTLVA